MFCSLASNSTGFGGIGPVGNKSIFLSNVGKIYFDSIKDNKTEEKPNDNKKDDIKEDNNRQNDASSTNKIDVIKKIIWTRTY